MGCLPHQAPSGAYRVETKAGNIDQGTDMSDTLTAHQIADKLNAYEASHSHDAFDDNQINNVWQDVIWQLAEVDFVNIAEGQSAEIPLLSREVIRWAPDAISGPWIVVD